MKKSSFLQLTNIRKIGLTHAAIIMTCLVFTACAYDAESELNNHETDIRNEYTKAWIKVFDLIDPQHDWCTLATVTAHIELPSDVAQVYIYNGDPSAGGHLIGRASASGSIKIDMPEGADRIYARTVDADGYTLTRGYYPIDKFHTVIDGQSMALPVSRSGDDVTYAHTPSYFDAMLICEDLGSIGDFDFNDIVIGLKHQSGDDPSLTIVPMAAGGVLATDIYFDGERLDEIHNMLNPGAAYNKMLNTSTDNIGSVTKLPHIVISLNDLKYKDWTIADNWGDIAIKVKQADATITITRPTEGAAPQMICIGGDWFWPRERVDINKAYKKFKDWSCDAGATTWFGSWSDAKVVKWDVPEVNPDLPVEPEKMWFKAVTADASDYTVHINGSATASTIASGEKYYIEAPLTSFADMFAVYSTSQAFVMQPDGSFLLGYPVVDNKITAIEFSPNFDLSAVTSFAHAFDGCKSLTSINIAEVEKKPTATLTDVTAMFHYCEQLPTLDLGGWNTSGVTSYFDVFGYCSALRTLDLDGWSIAPGANLRRFLGNTSSLTVKCPAQVEAALSADDTVGGASTTYIRP